MIVTNGLGGGGMPSAGFGGPISFVKKSMKFILKNLTNAYEFCYRAVRQ